jgi:hypothetical protein
MGFRAGLSALRGVAARVDQAELSQNATLLSLVRIAN